MIDRALLKTTVLDQQRDLISKDALVERELTKNMTLNAEKIAIIVKGVRRCGKSTLLKQILKEKEIFYLNFDDERLAGFQASDFQILMEVFIELLGKRSIVLFDEIQNISGWELFVNRILREGYLVYITGSNSNLLSRELGTHMTGRHLDYELYPFSFKEYLLLKNPDIKDTITTDQKAEIKSAFQKYLTTGGMPEFLKYEPKEILGQIVDDIIQKDIVQRYQVRKQNELRAVLRYLISNSGKRITYRSIADNFGIKSDVTVQKYIRYAEETYLMTIVNKYERKARQFDKNPKKIYCVDNGIVVRYSSSIEQSKGSLLESIVLIELRRRGKATFYYINKNGTETDFVLVDQEDQKKKIIEAIQVCIDPTDPETKKREELALVQTLNEANLNCGKILTLDYDEIKTINNKKIDYISVLKWLIN